MIFKLKISEDIPFLNALEKIGTFGDFCFAKKTFYLNTGKSIKEIENLKEISEVKKVKCTDKFESEMIRNWCIEKLSALAIKDFEDSEDGQNRINSVLEYLDKMEKEIKEKEVCNVGEKTDEKRNSNSDKTK